MKKLFLFWSIILFISCGKAHKTYNATILEKGADCGNTFLIHLEPSNEISIGINITYYGLNLPNEYKIEGKQVYLEYRKPSNEEMLNCTTMGIYYPQIFIVKVE